jgi:TPP-dependent pyruvate/acetoin dehydrogenase alpha subunit
MHLTDLEHTQHGSSGVVGGSVPISVGMAFALKYKNRSNIVVSMFGDGASNQGMTLESLNLASVCMFRCSFIAKIICTGCLGRHAKFVGGGDLSARDTSFWY